MPDTLIGAPVAIAYPGDRCGEGALWHHEQRCIYWTDINRFLVHRFDQAQATTRSWAFEHPVVALSLTTDPACLLVALGSRLVLWEPASDARIDLGFSLPNWPAERLNDGRTDPSGHFWVGSMRNNVGLAGNPLPAGGTDGRLFRVDGNGGSQAFRSGIGVANTLAWSPNRKLFYFADTLANMIWVHDYDEDSSTIGEPRPFFSGFERGWPDGSTIDSDGYLWNCRFGGSCIVRIAPDGEIDRIVEMPVTNPTTAVFGGEECKTLFVTSAAVSTPDTERLAGCLFAIETNVTGLPENHFHLR